MKYTVRAFIEGRDEKVDGICRTFCCMERTAYNLLREGGGAASVKNILRERYDVWNARWLQSVINQAAAVVESQERGIRYRIEMCGEKIRNTRQKMKRLSNPIRIQGCRVKISGLESRINELETQLDESSYPRAVFGSRKLLHQLSIAKAERRELLREEWKETRASHFFALGQANQRGNGNTRLFVEELDGCPPSFQLEVRNWPEDDFRLPLHVPWHWREMMRSVVRRAESVKLGARREAVEGGLAYSIRVVRCKRGYQVLVSFEVDETLVERNGTIAGMDINPEGIACTIVSKDGNLIATRFFKDNRLITASRNKRKWVMENLVNKVLRWCRDTYRCNAVAVEDLRFKGAYDYDPATNYKLSNFMWRKMLGTIKLDALKMGILQIEVNPAYTSKVAITKYRRQFAGFNRHQLASFVIARRALGHGETPTELCLPRTKKERVMWNYCIAYYGYRPQVQTLLHHEPMEWKSDGDGNGGGAMTELLRAPPASTSARGLGHTPVEMAGVKSLKHQMGERVGSIQTVTPTGEMELEGIELTLRTKPVRRHLSSLISNVIR